MAGRIIAIAAAVLFACFVLYGIWCDPVKPWLLNRLGRDETLRMSDVVHVPDVDEDERMEVLRCQLDELWEDEEDPRDSFADAVLDCLEWIHGLPVWSDRRAA